jgi:hypothetical protein
MRTFPRAAIALVALAACSSSDAPPELILSISSPLAIPAETNRLVATVQPNGAMSQEQSYDLGSGLRGSWPQTLPIIGGAKSARDLSLTIELRNSLPGMASVAVGYVQEQAELPASGTSTVAVVVPRSCVDRDGDGYGIGFGCKGPDCNDNDPTVPDPNPCPPVDAGMQTTGGDGGPQQMGDGGRPADAGLDCSNGGPMCDSEHTCYLGGCFKKCMSSMDCGDLAFGCVPVIDVCACKVPCIGPIDCGMNQCVDGCCRI